MTAKNNNNRTKTFKRVPETKPMPPSNVTLTLALLQSSGGEMYGM